MSYEKQQQIEEAINMIQEAMSIVDDAVAGTSIESNYRAYGKYGFSQLLGNGNPHDSSLHSLIYSLHENNENDFSE
jgi:hypothetical protein